MTSHTPFIDISVAISSETPVWPGDPAIALEPALRITEGDPVNVSHLRIGTHSGTHIDPPLHFMADGQSVDQLPLAPLIGPCWVVDLGLLDRHIEDHDLEIAGIPQGTRRLLLKTRNSRRWGDGSSGFAEDFLALTPAAARWVVAAGIHLVGIDYLSIEPFDGSDGETHRILLGAGVIPLEGLNLRGVAPGGYTLICLPLKIEGGDGAPCRALLAPLSFGE